MLADAACILPIDCTLPGMETIMENLEARSPLVNRLVQDQHSGH